MPRELCKHCQRPPSVCICPYLVNLQAPCRLLILQHPSEQKQALATVPILKMCIDPLQVLVGEAFADHALVKALMDNPRGCRVLFPSQDSQQWDLSTVTAIGQGVDQPPIETLIIIDGTWRKAKRIWHLNPWLATLPCVGLAGLPPSQYQIRSSAIEGGVSTLEAVMYACQYLTKSSPMAPDYQSLLKPFTAMIDMQIKNMGEAVFLAHYHKIHTDEH